MAHSFGCEKRIYDSYEDAHCEDRPYLWVEAQPSQDYVGECQQKLDLPRPLVLNWLVALKRVPELLINCCSIHMRELVGIRGP